MRLRLVADADAHREPVVQTDVVLPVEAELVLPDLLDHLPVSLRICGWQPGVEGFDAAEGERSRTVLRVEVAVLVTLEEEPNPHLVLAPDIEVDVVGQLEA